jgi:hypothetical protein
MIDRHLRGSSHRCRQRVRCCHRLHRIILIVSFRRVPPSSHSSLVSRPHLSLVLHRLHSACRDHQSLLLLPRSHQPLRKRSHRSLFVPLLHATQRKKRSNANQSISRTQQVRSTYCVVT